MTPQALKRARRRLGLSQKGLARALGVASDRTIRRWESGSLDIKGSAIVALGFILEREGLSPAAYGIHGVTHEGL